MRNRIVANQLAPMLGLSADKTEEALALVAGCVQYATGPEEESARDVTRVLHRHTSRLLELCGDSPHSIETVAAALVTGYMAANAFAGDIREGMGDQEHFASAYEGRVIYELLQNLHDAIAHTNGVSPIGRFGLGVKSLTNFVDAVVLRSGPFSLWFEPATVKTLRPDGASLVGFPLLPFPLPFPRDDRLPNLPGDSHPGIGMVKWKGRIWLWSRHQGLSFSPEDLDGFRRRHLSGKTISQSSHRDGGKTVLLFRLCEADDSQAVKTIRASLHNLESSILLFLPGLDTLVVDDVGDQRKLVLEPLGRHGRMELLRALPENRLWLRATTTELGFAFPIPKGKISRKHFLTSWFPVTEIIPGLPFVLHDRKLDLKDNRKSLIENHNNLRRLKALGQWAADKAGEVAAACKRGPLATHLTPLKNRLPRVLLPKAPRNSAMPLVGNLEQLTSSSEAADLLRASFMDTFRKSSMPVFSTESGPRPVKEALWIPPAKHADARKCRKDLKLATGGRIVTNTSINKWLEDNHLSPLYPLDPEQPQSILFPDLAKLEPGWVCAALVRLGKSMVCGKRIPYGKLVPVYRFDRDYRAVTSLYRLLDGEENITFEEYVAVPVTQNSPGDHLVRGVILTGKLEGDDNVLLEPKGIRFLESMGYLVADSSVGEKAGKQLKELGARRPQREEILENLAEEAEHLQGLTLAKGVQRAREAWGLACDLVNNYESQDDQPSSHPLASVVALYGKLKVDRFVRDSRSILSVEEMRLLKKKMALARLVVPTLDGNLRAVSELTVTSEIPLPQSLKADIPAIALWMGTKDVKRVHRILLQFGAWISAPIIIRCKRLEPHLNEDELFDRFWNDYQPPEGWLQMIPALSKEGQRCVIPPKHRLPLRWDLHCTKFLHNDEDAWHWCAGHVASDRIAVVIDAPPELCRADGLRRAQYAELLAESLEQEAVDGDSSLRWSWFLALEGWRDHYRRWAARVSCRGDLPSPLLYRLRHTRWLKRDKRIVGNWSSEPPGRIAPVVATTWQRQQLEQRPWRFLPVAHLGEEKARLLCLASPPADVSQAGVHPADPRWILATLFRISRKCDETRENRPDVKHMKDLCARLLQHLAHALKLTGQPRSTSFPKAGQTWASYYKSSTQKQDDAKLEALAGWLKDMVQARFLDESEVADMLSASTLLPPLDVVGKIPIFIVRDRDGQFETLDRTWKDPGGIVGSDQPSDVEQKISKTLGLIAFPRDLVSFARFLRLPLFALGKPHKPKSVQAPSWSKQLVIVMQRILPWLIRAAVEAGPRVDEDALSLRMSKGLRWHYVESLSQNVPVLGLPKRHWSAQADVSFRCLVRAVEARQKKRRTVPLIGVIAGMTESQLRTRLVELAQPLAEAMGLVGSGTRLAMEYVLHRCSEPSAWAALGMSNQPLPTSLKSFLTVRGWLHEGGPDGVGMLHRRLNRFLSAVGLEPLSQLNFDPDATDARPKLQRALHTCWPEAPEIAIQDISVAELETNEVPARCLVWLQNAAGLNTKQISEGLEQSGLRLHTLIDGTSLQEAWSLMRRESDPAIVLLVEAGHLSSNPLTTLEAGTFLGKDLAEMKQHAGQTICTMIRDRALRQDLLLAFDQQDLEAALDHALEQAGLSLPGCELRERAAWKSLLVDAARVLQGSAALAVLETERVEPLDVRFDQWRRNPEWTVSRMLESDEEMVPRTAAGLARMFRLEEPTHAPRLKSGSQLAEIVTSWAKEHFPEDFARLIAQSGPTVTILGQDFLTERHAEDALNARRDELEAHDPEIVEVQPQPPRGQHHPDHSEKASGGRSGVRFSARAGLVGREGEQYLLNRLLTSKCMPCSGDVILALDVRNAHRAAEARSNSRVAAWLNRREVTNWPGFDILLCYSHKGHIFWDGVEVKSSVQPLGETVEINWTDNELRAARQTTKARWPIDAYRICCVTRLWSLEEGRIVPPQITWFNDPLELVETHKAHLETTAVRHTLKIRLQ